jgi:hypothetical protein
VRSLGQAAETIAGLTDDRLKTFIQWQSSIRSSFIVPPQVDPASTYVYYAPAVMQELTARRWQYTACFYGALALAAIGAGLFGSRLLRRRRNFVRFVAAYVVPAGILMLTLYALRDPHVSYKWTCAMLFLVASDVGLWLSLIRHGAIPMAGQVASPAQWARPSDPATEGTDGLVRFHHVIVKPLKLEPVGHLADAQCR